MLFKSSAPLHYGFAIKTQCGTEEQLCYLRSILVNLKLPHNFFPFARNLDIVPEVRVFFSFLKLLEKYIISFLLSVG